MRLYRLGLLLFCSIGVLLCLSGAPSPGYKLVPDWPAPPRSAAGTPSAWNLIQVPGVDRDADLETLCDVAIRYLGHLEEMFPVPLHALIKGGDDDDDGVAAHFRDRDERPPRVATSWCSIAARTPSSNSIAPGSSCAPGETGCSARER